MKASMQDHQAGMILIVAMIMLLAVSMLGVSAMKTGIFQEKMAVNNRLDSLAFQAAESAIDATISASQDDPDWLRALQISRQHELCLSGKGVTTGLCGEDGLPLGGGQESSTSLPTLYAHATTQYMGTAPVAGYAVDQVVFHRFSTEGAGHFAVDSVLPYGHVNAQVWQKVGPTDHVFNK